MPYNGAGVFSRVYSWVVDAANNVDVDATRTDTDSNDIAAGLSLCITKDGQQTVTANIPMAGFKLTGLGSGTVTTDASNFGQVVSYAAHLVEGRLSLTNANPVPTTDITAAGTLYLVPYRGNRIALFDGSNWLVATFATPSIAIPAAANQMYDVWCYLNSGVPTLELLAWTNDTTRATALTSQDGVFVKNGDATRRYLGSIRTKTASQANDSMAFRHVWNYYNRVRRLMRVVDATANWAYSSATIRQANANAANQLDFVLGWSDEVAMVQTCGQALHSVGGVNVSNGFGIDSTTTYATASGLGQGLAATVISTTDFHTIVTGGSFYPAVGRHFVAWLEAGASSGATQFNSNSLCGIQGEILG